MQLPAQADGVHCDAHNLAIVVRIRVSMTRRPVARLEISGARHRIPVMGELVPDDDGCVVCELDVAARLGRDRDTAVVGETFDCSGGCCGVSS